MTLPLITRAEEEAICRLHAASFNMLTILQGFVRNRRDIHAEEPFVDPLWRLMNMAEDVLEQAGFPVGESALRQPVDITEGRLVIVESPFAGEVTRNIAYARQACRDCLLKGEHPIASHLLYTQPGILDDNHPDERKRGIEAGLAWRKAAQKAVFYTGRGWSQGMEAAKAVYDAEGFPYEVRDMPALPIGAIGSNGANLPFPADPFGMGDEVPIDLSDIPEVGEEWFDGAELVRPGDLAPPRS